MALTLGCSSLLELDALRKSDCEHECGSAGASAGTKSHGGDAAGAAQGGSSSVSGADSGGSAASVGGGGSSGTTGGVNGAGGSGAAGSSGGVGSAGSGSDGGSGAQPIAGGPAGGTAGVPGVEGCEPSATDESCDGLDENCHETSEDVACTADCAGAYVNGTSYMSCWADSDFDQAEAACQGNGMHLVKIDSELENDTVLGLAADEYAWIGGSNRDDLHAFIWVDGSLFYDFEGEIPGAYQNFSATEPDWDERWRCVEQDADGSWSTWDCLDGQSFVCERY